MPNLLSNIEKQKDAILLGEIGALLHMFGKASSEFLQAYSVEGGAQDTHQDPKNFPELWSRLNRPELKDIFSFPLHGQVEKLRGSFTDFIGKYKGKAPDCMLLQLFNTCHGKTSSDEKGVVRRKPSINDMWISTPFGYNKDRRIDPACIDTMRIEMDKKLARALDLYLNNSCGIEDLWETAVQVLQPGLSQALGETRLPANDVNLWAQSRGVASLFKPVLVSLAIGKDPCPMKNGKYDYNDVRWRLLGVGWNGLGFIECGRKPSDIMHRQEILNTVTKEVRRVIEVEFPLGNLVYRDLSGLFFTFPGVTDDDVAEELVQELATKIVPLIRKHSNDELWPFLTLSKPRRTMTMIAKEMQSRDGLAAVPRVATILSIEREDSSREEHLLMDGSDLTGPATGQDVCSVCGFRSKPATDETCSICWERRQDRQYEWQSKRQGQTIWIDEVADARNRVALLTIRFDLSRWLSGERLMTVFSQSYNDWYNSARLQRILRNPQQARKLNTLLNSSAVAPTVEAVTGILEFILADPVKDTGFKVPLLNTFFEDIDASPQPGENNYILRFLDNLRGKINKDPSYSLTAEDLATSIFTQNPSPGRLARIWEETEEYLWLWLSRVNSSIFPIKPQRFIFKTYSAVDGVRAGQTYRIVVPGLIPKEMVVLCLDNGGQDFLTVDSLAKFRLERDDVRFQGLSAVQQAIVEGGIISWVDEETSEQLSQAVSPSNPVRIDGNRFAVEPYLPYTVLAFSPVFCQVLFPADSIPAVLKQLLALYNERFQKVQGKLPIHVNLLAAKRKYPLYALLDAGQQILNHPSFGKGLMLSPWWETSSLSGDPFFSAYPSKSASNGKHNITELTVVSGSQAIWMTPGYFDFDLLGSTADRHRLNYEGRKDHWPVRPSVGYGRIRPRPFPLHYLQRMFEIWDDLYELSRAQRHQLEDALRTKLEEWVQVGEEYMSVFVRFGRVVLRDAYGDKWQKLSVETKRRLEGSLEDGLLLETLELFQHVIKEGSLNE
ncbi:CRISPR-associated protein Csx11 [Pelotomaculum propionicicum]|uniref:CRISPR-associated protein Csx11 n=1 Tax=Pelotomaculum propionicicum TaxID=258475 RepID=A0A4Y7RVP2_9FIRM|nr:CRISPR-associated protein Csx11 [Pelotomaculum propionicicum]TEB12830.1 hypothetical protein Pmgp_00806 [Pelotomaculum propionicicum]